MAGDAAPASVLQFWFGPGEGAARHSRREWFAKDPAFDRALRARFGALIEAALAGALGHWDEPPRHRLARILLLDQFTRNAYRGQARAFSGDARAQADALALLDGSHEFTFDAFERAFVYMPLVHAESLALQSRAVALFDALAAEFPALADYARHARRHRRVIERFGRFPHRNALLGRPSSPPEVRFLATPGARF